MNYAGLVNEEYRTAQRETSFSENYMVSITAGIIQKQAQTDFAAVNRADTIIKAINHEVRLQIIKMLEEKRRVKVGDIYQQLGLDQSVASVQLAILRHSDIVVTERNGRVIYYSLNYSRIAEISYFCKMLHLLQKEQ